jgi:hypothetical protein
MNLASYQARQEQDFIRAFLIGHYPVGIRNTSILEKFTSPPATWEWDTTFGKQKAFIRTVRGQFKEYWIDVREADHRYAFNDFLQAEYQVPLATMTPDLNMDHMLNKAFALRHGLQFVRVALLPRDYNQGWGGKVEELLTKVLARHKSAYRLDCFIFMKIMNFLPPRNIGDYQLRRTILAQQISGKTGLNPSIVLEGIDGIFQLWDVL